MYQMPMDQYRSRHELPTASHEGISSFMILTGDLEMDSKAAGKSDVGRLKVALAS